MPYPSWLCHTKESGRQEYYRQQSMETNKMCDDCGGSKFVWPKGKYIKS